MVKIVYFEISAEVTNLTEDIPVYRQDYNLNEIKTPVNVNKLVQLLELHQYDPGEIQFLRSGFESGFDIGYTGPQIRQSHAKNIPFTVGNEIVLWNKLMKEVGLGRVAGPFDQVPFPNYIQSPIGLVPKAGSDKTCLIFHLSYQFQTEPSGSVNFHTPRHLCTVKYRDLDFAAKVILDLARRHKGTRTVYTAKTNTSSAFRILPLSVLS